MRQTRMWVEAVHPGGEIACAVGEHRIFGQVFSPAVTMIFAFKAIGFSLAVAWIPLSAAVDETAPRQARHRLALQGLIRMFSVILLIEIVSLLGNYA